MTEADFCESWRQTFAEWGQDKWTDGETPAIFDDEYYVIIEALERIEYGGELYLNPGELALDTLYYARAKGGFEGATGRAPRWKVLFWAPIAAPSIPFDIREKVRNRYCERVRYDRMFCYYKEDESNDE